MLELIGISHQFSRGGKAEPVTSLDHISFTAPSGHLMAVLGATMSGKTTLLQVIAGQMRASHGAMVWRGKDIAKAPVPVNEAGFVPQEDDVLLEALTVQENIVSAYLLRVAGADKKAARDRAAHLMAVAKLETLGGTRVSALSKAERRRVKLAVALVSDPALVLCDDFTDGLDAKSERELAALLQLVARDHPHRLVINATANPMNLSCYDSTLLMHDGCACFHGPAKALCHYFSVKQTEEIFSRLAKRPAKRWGESWDKHRDSYYDAFKLGQSADSLAAAEEGGGAGGAHDPEAEESQPERSGEAWGKKDAAASAPSAATPLPSLLFQLTHLLRRRWTVFARQKRDWLAHLLMLVGFPLLAALFAGRSNSLLTGENASDALPTAYAVAMLLLIQIIFVIFMAVRNGSREIAAERNLFERERLGGLRAPAYLVSKILFVTCLFLAQSVWFTIFLDMAIGKLPGSPVARVGLIVLTSGAFTLLSLGISAISRDSERASNLCLLLAFLQIPFSGALLALPNVVGSLVHPLATSYSGWSGIMDTMPAALIQSLDTINGTWFATPAKAATLLGIHALIGIILCSVGLARRRPL